MYSSIFSLNKKLSFAISFFKPLIFFLLLRLNKFIRIFFLLNKDIHRGTTLSTRLWTTFFKILLSSSYHPVIHKRTRCAKRLLTPLFKLCITLLSLAISTLKRTKLSTFFKLFLLLNKVIHC